MKRMRNRGELGVQTVKFAGPHGTGSMSCHGKEEKVTIKGLRKHRMRGPANSIGKQQIGCG